MKSRIKILTLSILISISSIQLQAKEGMWLPILLKSIEGDMKSMGLKLSAEDIYSINQSSLKDAVISFGGFCTGEIISDQGLILTNHHCGYRSIQSHSSVENDYLTDGYWAKSLKDELHNEGLTATFIVRMEDVTDAILQDLAGLAGKEREEIIKNRMDSLTNLATEDTHYEAYIRPFYYGKEYYMFVTEVFKDVRMVGAPPSAIGKFGGDTDNWSWPRHTGDFSLFRIYADSNNLPADYSENNVPYKPRHHLPISTKGIQEGDFTMVFGFPGTTDEYLTSDAIRYIKEELNPARIAVREAALEIMDKQMKASDKVRIQYASKYASASNYWKKWIGENRGLQASNAIGKKEKEEAAYRKAVAGQSDYEGLLAALEQEQSAIEPYTMARNYFIEIPYRRLEIINLASRFRTWFKEDTFELSDDEKDKMKKRIESHFKDFDSTTDSLIAIELMQIYKRDMKGDFLPEFLSNSDDMGALVSDLYANSLFNDREALTQLIDSGKTEEIIALQNDKAFVYMKQFWDVYYEMIKPDYDSLDHRLDSLYGLYVEGMRKYVDGKYYPNANSTLRLAYGKVEDYDPRDGVEYDFFTTTNGILEKYDPTNVDFDLPERLVELIQNSDYGDYADKDGSMRVCFIASNHTTGGNSGSPVINAKGQLIGLNFDRNWEGTMSDINYDINLCRNISVDIRYVLWVVDKFAGAQRLIDEMELVAK
ncbi:MAG: serine protease [Flavobacteriales bacterium]|nr:serine protease [Flavobacteriales bacterium]